MCGSPTQETPAPPGPQPNDRLDPITDVEGLASFTLGLFRFGFRALDELILPQYKGAVFRGGFGLAMREMSCLPNWKRPCSLCLLKGDCAYSYLFETPNSVTDDLLDGVSHAPHPFVLRPPLSTQTHYRPGDTFEVDMILIGRALSLLPRVICAFESFGSRGIGAGLGKFRLEAVSTGYDRDWRSIYSPEEGILSQTTFGMTAVEIMGGPEPSKVNEISVEILTPLRMKSGGSLSDALTFSSLITSLLRRTHLLDHWHCGGRLTFDHKAVIKLSREVTTLHQDLRWLDWERYSFRQDAKLKMGGLVGSIRFQGPLTSFIPYLRLGEAIHIGKGTAFGLGMLVVNADR